MTNSDNSTLKNRIRGLLDSELEEGLKSAVRKERMLLHEVLSLIQEIDRRRLYLERSHPSLFSYLTRELDYSFAAAMRRIDAARMLNSVPEVGEALVNGGLNLSQLSEVTRSIRAVENRKQEAVSREAKSALISAIRGKDIHETQQIIAQSFETPVRKFDRKRVQADASVLLSITLRKDQYQKLEDSRNRAAHKLSQLGRMDCWSDVIELLAENYLKEFALPRNSIPQNTLREVLARSQVCEFKNPSTGLICGSRYRLQVDHIQPRWAGGGDEVSNLQVLCANHNQHRYQQQAGISRG